MKTYTRSPEEYNKHKRVMSYFGKVIWTDGMCYMVAKGDRTDEYFDTIYDAMKWIENKKM